MGARRKVEPMSWRHVMAKVCFERGCVKKRIPAQYVQSHADWHARGQTTRGSRNARLARAEARALQQVWADADPIAVVAETPRKGFLDRMKNFFRR